MKKKLIISILIMNVMVVVGLITCYEYFRLNVESFSDNTVLVSLDNNIGDPEASFAFSKKEQEKLKKLDGVKEIEFIDGRVGSAYVHDNNIPDGKRRVLGKNATNMSNDYSNLNYSKGREIRSSNEAVISESLASHLSGNPLGQSLIMNDNPQEEKIIVGVYKTDKFNKQSSDFQFYTRDFSGVFSNFSNSDELLNVINGSSNTDYSKDDLVKIYGQTLKSEAYVKLDGSRNEKDFENDANHVVKEANYYSGDQKFSKLQFHKLGLVLISADLIGVLYIGKLYFFNKNRN